MISLVINYCNHKNRLLFGSATRFLEYTHTHTTLFVLIVDFLFPFPLCGLVFPYLKDVKIDFAWGGPMACSANLFPRVLRKLCV